MNKKPIELHVIDGTKPNHNARHKPTPTLLPQTLKKRIPAADWLDNPAAWNKREFIEKTAEFLFEAYGIGSEQDAHALSMLANHIEVYVKCVEGYEKTGVVTKFNGGKTIGLSPYLTGANKATTMAMQLMNELGLTPRGRLSGLKSEDTDDASRFMRGPKG